MKPIHPSPTAMIQAQSGYEANSKVFQTGAILLAILNNTVVGLVARQDYANLAEARREFAYQVERAFSSPAA